MVPDGFPVMQSDARRLSVMVSCRRSPAFSNPREYVFYTILYGIIEFDIFSSNVYRRTHGMKNRTGWLFPALITLVIISGCAAPAPKREEVFFPEPPDLPRLQYLTS